MNAPFATGKYGVVINNSTLSHFHLLRDHELAQLRWESISTCCLHAWASTKIRTGTAGQTAAAVTRRRTMRVQR
jgi:hypothetical protein